MATWFAATIARVAPVVVAIFLAWMALYAMNISLATTGVVLPTAKVLEQFLK